MDSVIELLEELLLYMEERYDVGEGHTYTTPAPNEEMYFGMQIETAIKLLKKELQIQCLKKEIENV